MRTVVRTMAAVMVVAGCASAAKPAGPTPPTLSATQSPNPACSPPAGGRCAGAASLAGASIELSKDGRTLTYVSNCGGTLTAVREASDVQVTYIASTVRAGAMACARVPVSAQLASALGTLPVVDSVSGETLHVTRS